MSKQIAIVVAGAGAGSETQAFDIQIDKGMTADSVLSQIGLPNYILSTEKGTPIPGNADLYDKVSDKSKLWATTKADVGM